MTHDKTKHIVSFIESECGFFFDDKKRTGMFSLVRERMSSVGVDSPEAYLSFIKSLKGSSELKNLISCVTVGETYFLRNKDHWRAFKKFVLPRIIDSKNGKNRSVKIWSAGCSTGEEAYTIAVSLLESLPFPQNWDIKIMATDINEASLAKARAGVYTRNAFRGVEEQWVKKWFTEKKGAYRIRKEVRKIVDFSSLNLVSQNRFPSAYTDPDIIFCRNVLMYFRKEVYMRVIKQFAECLKPGEFLFLGHAEGAMARQDNFKSINCCDTFIFQKRNDFGSRILDFGLNWKNENDQQSTVAKTPQPETLPDRERKSTFHRPKSKIQNPKSYTVALNYYFQENSDAALKAFPENDNKNVGLKNLILKTMIHLDSSDWVNAEKSLQELRNESDILPEVYVLEAMLKEVKGDHDGAVKANQAAIFLDKDFFAPRFRLARIYQNQGHVKKAQKHFEHALKSLGRDSEDRMKLFCGGASRELLEEICGKSIADFAFRNAG